MDWRKWMLVAGLAAAAQVCAAEPIEVLAMGDSLTNGRGLPREFAYPAQLEALLKAGGLDVAVVNAGIDGDDSPHIYQRMTAAATARTKIVIFQESGNDINQASGVEYTEKALAWLKDRGIPTILVSNKRVQSEAEALALAEKYGVVYYGPFRKGIPNDAEHVQPGEYFAKKNKVDYHLTAAGCGLLAKYLEPLVRKVIADRRDN
jgi:acyl-CoA thioesterase-1